MTAKNGVKMTPSCEVDNKMIVTKETAPAAKCQLFDNWQFSKHILKITAKQWKSKSSKVIANVHLIPDISIHWKKHW